METRVLVLDDDVYCLDIFIEYLMDKGFHVLSFENPTCPVIEQNLETCPMNAPCYDLVLSDNRMPEMTGLEFFLYQEQKGCKIPTGHKALISGDISWEEQKKAVSMGYKMFKKPTSLHLIDHWIDGILDQES